MENRSLSSRYLSPAHIKLQTTSFLLEVSSLTVLNWRVSYQLSYMYVDPNKRKSLWLLIIMLVFESFNSHEWNFTQSSANDKFSNITYCMSTILLCSYHNVCVENTFWKTLKCPVTTHGQLYWCFMTASVNKTKQKTNC